MFGTSSDLENSPAILTTVVAVTGLIGRLMCLDWDRKIFAYVEEKVEEIMGRWMMSVTIVRVLLLCTEQVQTGTAS